MPAPRKTPVRTPAAEPATKVDLNALLEHDEPAAEVVEEVETEASAPTIEQIELEALRAELAAVRAREAEVKPERKNEAELTSEEKQIRALQDQLAKANGKKIDTVEDVFEDSEDGVVLIHVLKDGLTAQGRVWYYGQEISFGPEAYRDTLDRFGVSWLSQSEEDQINSKGEVLFGKGPWPGKRGYTEKSLANVSISNKAPVVRVEA